ncbi:hypothetical protein HOLleu_13754 [Holothuria leucospilota]|uniref:Uncharacterized protein n=1 Tax=Holothuria leucospilota TaxID=206669 RepID=A0A9Q1HB73_HOLLE|nr:hypothetical protein HOLleu_13754 [Holothuria leucospilota]
MGRQGQILLPINEGAGMGFIFRTTNGNQQSTLTDLTRFQVEGVLARFAVDREALEQVLQNRKREDGFCGQDVNLQLPQSLTPSACNTSQEGEILLFYGNITDLTLANELTNDLKEQVATTHRSLTVMMPVIIGNTEKHGILYLRIFTHSKKKIIHPYSTSIQEITRVESMEEEEDGTVRLQIGDDVMAFKVQDGANDRSGKNVGKGFDKVHGKILTLTSYPLPFDWGCDFIGSQISFCRALEEVRCQLAAVGGDVCLQIATSSSERLPGSMKVTNMTGMFRDICEASTIPSFTSDNILASREREISLFYGNITHFTLINELTNDLKEKVATTFRFLAVMMRVVIGKTEKHGILHIRIFTDSKKTIIHPYSTSIKEVIQADSMEEEEDGIVRLRIGDDVMAFTMQEKVNCQGEKNVGKDFDRGSGKVLTFTSYPLPFDWNFGFMGSQISFCRALEEVQCALAAVGGDVCLRLTTGSSKRVPAFMKVVNMTGIFRDMFPYLAETVPSESFEAELIDREHTTGVTFPCLNS